jgi:hypothetical protein
MRRGGTLEGEEDAGVPLRHARLLSGCEDFLYTLKASLRAAACGGRPRPARPVTNH